MSIDPKTLPTAYQAQIAAKLLQNQREKAVGKHAAGFEKPSKYRNTPDTRNGTEGRKIRFDSKAEARRYDELMLMLKAGKIRNLKLQPQFTLQEAYTTPEGNRVRAMRYQADFSYDLEVSEKCSGLEKFHYVFTVEDVKSRATKTRVYQIKKKLMRERLGIEITEVE